MALRTSLNRLPQFKCSCPSCSSLSALNARGRTAIQASRPRIFRTSILPHKFASGYATALDGERKIGRKQQWDEAVVEQKSDLEDSRKAINVEKKKNLQSSDRISVSGTREANTDTAHDYTTVKDQTRILEGQVRTKGQWEEILVEQDRRLGLLETIAVNSRRKRTESSDLRPAESDVDRLSRLQASEKFDSNTPVDPTTAMVIAKSSDLQMQEATERKLSKYQDMSRGHRHFSAIPVIPTTAEPIKPHRLPPQSLWSCSGVRAFGRRANWTSKKMYTVELCMIRLVLQLCLASGLSEVTPSQAEHIPASLRPFVVLSNSEAEMLAREIELELTSFWIVESNAILDRKEFSVPLPQYQNWHAEEELEQIAFNDKLKDICRRETESSLLFMKVTSICEAILESQTRPNIDTMNVLLLFALGLQRHDMSKAVVATILDGRFRPNEITSSLVLRHYRQTKDEKRFIEYIELMCGGLHGLMLAKPWLAALENAHKSQGREIVAGTKLIQAVTPSPLILLEMIMGLARFAGLLKTWAIYLHLSSLGWGLDYPCMYILLLRSAVEELPTMYAEIWSKVQDLARSGHRIPEELYALMIAIHKLNQEKDAAWQKFEECLKDYPRRGMELVRLIHSRMKLIQSNRIAEGRVRDEEYSRLEEEYSNWYAQQHTTISGNPEIIVQI